MENLERQERFRCEDADAVEIDIIHKMISENSTDMNDILDIIDDLPYLNELPARFDAVLERIGFANEILPRLQMMTARAISALVTPKDVDILPYQVTLEKCQGKVGVMKALAASHALLLGAEELSAEWNTPVNETYAALAHVGTQTCIYLMTTQEDKDLRVYAKTNLVYFSCIEMLALGAKTGALQFHTVSPNGARSDMFLNPEVIVPLVKFEDDEAIRRYQTMAVFNGHAVSKKKNSPDGTVYYSVE